jgi:hypothetical protein
VCIGKNSAEHDAGLGCVVLGADAQDSQEMGTGRIIERKIESGRAWIKYTGQSIQALSLFFSQHWCPGDPIEIRRE